MNSNVLVASAVCFVILYIRNVVDNMNNSSFVAFAKVSAFSLCLVDVIIS